jgi:hypothetical protein
MKCVCKIGETYCKTQSVHIYRLVILKLLLYVNGLILNNPVFVWALYLKKSSKYNLFSESLHLGYLSPG